MASVLHSGAARRRVFELNSKRREKAPDPLQPAITCNQKTAAKWLTGPRLSIGLEAPKNKLLTPAEAIVVAFRKKTRLETSNGRDLTELRYGELAKTENPICEIVLVIKQGG